MAKKSAAPTETTEQNNEEVIQPENDSQESENITEETTNSISQSKESAAPTETTELLQVGSASVQVISSSKTDPKKLVDTSLVKIKANYPEGYKGQKYLVNGKEYEVSKETAEQLIKQGIAARV